jgi:sigma-B regulation protein RsbU (phosphoserine phosphatase)
MSENLLKRISELESQVKGYEKLLKQANDKLLQLAGEISTDLEWAIKLQKKIVPTEMPRIKGFEFSSKFLPGSRFGGDYFDIFEHNDKWKFGIFLSSCSGYTVSSALMGLLIKYSTQVEAKRGIRPHEFLQVMSSELLPSFKDKDKASFFYATVDRKTLKLEYSSAGMISVYRHEVGQDSVDYLNPIVPELSLGFKSTFTSNTISMEPQDRLLFSSPGLVVAANEKNEPWGVERMIEAWKNSSKKSVHEIRNEILYQQQNFLKGNLPERDQSLIVVEVQEKIIKLA